MTPAGFHSDTARRSWGRVHRGAQYVAQPAFGDDSGRLLESAAASGIPVLGAGLGRSYGDTGLNFDAALIDTTALDRLLSFDATTGLLRAEAGLSLGELLKFSVPRGWFLPTSPGTRFVTLAGAVANDVHGKNHHSAGTFGASVRRIGLLRSDRGLIELAPDSEPELFRATIGGLGLTGLMLWVELQLAPVRSAWLDTETIAFNDLGGFFSLAADSVQSFEHTVAWVDCTRSRASLGRGLFSRGNWSTDGRLVPHDDARKFSLPFEPPGFTLNPLTLRVFNELYYRVGRARSTRRAQHYDAFTYPLDSIGNWNRLYGSRGFYQYQCVVPPGNAEPVVRELLATIATSGEGSFLAVLKTFGKRESPGLLSFPFEGTTLALDFSNREAKTLALFAKLDQIVSDANGRLYAAKDGRLPAALMRRGYPHLTRFGDSIDPAFSSSFWRRICNE